MTQESVRGACIITISIRHSHKPCNGKFTGVADACKTLAMATKARLKILWEKNMLGVGDGALDRIRVESVQFIGLGLCSLK